MMEPLGAGVMVSEEPWAMAQEQTRQHQCRSAERVCGKASLQTQMFRAVLKKMEQLGAGVSEQTEGSATGRPPTATFRFRCAGQAFGKK